MRPRGSITGPLVLIAIGAIFLVHAISPDFRIEEVLAQYWPYLLITWGVIAAIEVTIRFLSGASIPTNGISGAGWLVVILISIGGLTSYEVRRPDNWWRRAGFERSVEAFGEEHNYSVETLQKSVGTAPRIVIESFRGDAKIIAGEGKDVVLSGRKTVRAFDAHEADRTNTQTPVEMLVEGNTVIIRCHQEKAGPRTPVTTDLALTVPRGSSVEGTGTVGDFDVSGLTGDVDLSSTNAGMRVQDIHGNVKIDTRKSDLVRCANIGGGVELRGHGADVELTKIAGQVSISGDYTGTVSLREIAKPVRLENMRTALDAEGVPGEIRLDRGNLSLQNVLGPLKLMTRATDVTLNGFTEGLELTVDKGDIDLRPDRVPLGKMVVHTRSGNIELALPQSAHFALTASTDHGEIDNQFGEALKERTTGRGATLEGAVGSGPDLHLVTDRGSITIRKTSEAGGAGKISGFRKLAVSD